MSTVNIPYTIYFNDNTINTGTFVCEANKEGSYFLDVPKGTSGEIVRIELGPTDFDFHRFYMRLLCFKSGEDSDLEWVTLPPPPTPQG